MSPQLRGNLPAVFVDEFGDEKDVVSAGKHGEGEDGGVDRWQVVARTVRHAGGENNRGNRHDLYGGIDLPQQRRAKATKPRDDIDGRRANENKNVAANYGHSHPKRNGQMG